MAVNSEPINQPKLFHSLRAEDEPWLAEIYIYPAGFELYSSPQSMIFFAPIGGGRTALRRMIRQHLEGQPVLVVNWQPEAPEQELQGNPLASYAMRQLIHEWCQGILQFLGKHPERLSLASPLALQGLAFLVHRFMTVNPQFYLLSIAGSLPADGLAALQNVLNLPHIELLKPEADTRTSVQTLVSLLHNLGFKATWIFIDGLEKWPEGLGERSHQMLRALLDTLAYLDIPGMLVKACVPSDYATLYTRLGGVDRFRLLPQDLKWEKAELAEMVLRRAAKLSDRQDLSLADICTGAAWQVWLAKYGGDNPRAWLSLSKPFIEAWANHKTRLSKKKWQAISLQYPPKLRMDGDRQRVLVGEYEADVTPQDMSILQYLYSRPGKVISREEIYYRGIYKLEEVPAPKTKLYEDPTTWTGLFDTALWRLRQAIEPIPGLPIYLVTVRGKGITLNNTM